MKKHIKGANINVMLALLAVLFISLGYLSMQGKEGMEIRDAATAEAKAKKEGMKRRN
jgi:hypothetical protein